MVVTACARTWVMVGTQGRQGWLLGCNYRFRMLNTAFQSFRLIFKDTNVFQFKPDIILQNSGH